MAASTSATGADIQLKQNQQPGPKVTFYPERSTPSTGFALSVILPVYRYSHGIQQTYEQVARFAAGHPDTEFIFVNDGSPDDTEAKLRGFVESPRNPANVGMLTYAVNGGKGHAIKTGVFYTHAPYIIFMDGDLAYSLDHLPTMRAGLETHDMVIGSRSLIREQGGNKRSFLRWFMGEAFNRLMWLLTGIPFTDTQAGIKGFRREPAYFIFAHQCLKGFAFDVELIYIARRKGYTITEFPAHVSDDHNTKGSSMNLLVDPIKMFADLVRVRLNGLRGKYD